MDSMDPAGLLESVQSTEWTVVRSQPADGWTLCLSSWRRLPICRLILYSSHNSTTGVVSTGLALRPVSTEWGPSDIFWAANVSYVIVDTRKYVGHLAI